MNYKSYFKKEEYILKEALIHVTIISAIVFAIAYFAHDFKQVGLILIAAGFLPLISLKLTGEQIKESIAEIIFGMFNTGLITAMAIVGYNIEGILGAVIGDAITEGYSGILEGEVADLMLKWKIKEKIDPLNSSLGKMAGALFGGGIVLLIFSLI